MILTITRKLFAFAARQHTKALESAVVKAYAKADLADTVAVNAKLAHDAAEKQADAAITEARNTYSAAHTEAGKLGLRINPDIQ